MNDAVSAKKGQEERFGGRKKRGKYPRKSWVMDFLLFAQYLTNFNYRSLFALQGKISIITITTSKHNKIRIILAKPGVRLRDDN